MFQNLSVQESTDKVTSTSKPYKQLEIKDEAGATHKVNIFSDFPDFANVKPGSVLRGSLVQKGQYTNLLSETQAKGKFGAQGGYKTAQIEKVMDVKRQDISKFQDNKEASIKLASTIRMAVDVATSLTPDQWQSTTMQEEIRFWRAWFINEWDSVEPF